MAKANGALARKRDREVIPNAQRREATRAAVLKAAAAAFDESGYLATRLDDIVMRTGMTKGAVYFHFPSKDALAAELVTSYYHQLEQIAAAAHGADAVDTMIGLTSAVGAATRTDPQFRAGARLGIERDLIDPELPDPYEWWAQTFATLARRARRDGSLAATAAPATVARTAATFLVGAQQLAAGGRKPDLQRRLDEFWELMEPAVRPVPARTRTRSTR